MADRHGIAVFLLGDSEFSRMFHDDVQYEPQKQPLGQRSNGTLLKMIADAILVFVCNAGEGMLHHRLPCDFTEDFVQAGA